MVKYVCPPYLWNSSRKILLKAHGKRIGLTEDLLLDEDPKPERPLPPRIGGGCGGGGATLRIEEDGVPISCQSGGECPPYLNGGGRGDPPRIGEDGVPVGGGVGV